LTREAEPFVFDAAPSGDLLATLQGVGASSSTINAPCTLILIVPGLRMASRVFCFDVPLGWRDDAGAEGSDFCEDFSTAVRSGKDGLKALCAEEDASAGMAVRSETSMDVH